MITPYYFDYDRDARLAQATNAIEGDTIALELDLVDALDEIEVVCNFAWGATAPSGFTLNGLLGALKKATLQTPDGDNGEWRTVVDYSGIGLIELAYNTGQNLSADTLECISAHNGGKYFASGNYRLRYRIPLAPPMVTEGLRSHFLLPLMGMKQSPKLTLQFATLAEINATNQLATFNVEVWYVKRKMSPNFYNLIANDGGFIKFDLIENANNLGVGQTGEARFQIGPNGKYLGLMMRHYLGGASVTRADISAVTTLGSETKWTLQQGREVKTTWRNGFLLGRNQLSRSQGGPYQLLTAGGWNGAAGTAGITSLGVTGSAQAWANSGQMLVPQAPGGAMIAGMCVQNPASVYLPAAADDWADVTELGSVIDCDRYAALSQKTEVVCDSVASVATTGSTLYIGGYRLISSIDKWRFLKE